MSGQRPISPLYFAVMVTAAYTGAGIFQFPRTIVTFAGGNAAWSYLVECGMALGGLWLWFQVNHLYPNESLASFAQKVVSPVLGWPLLLFSLAVHTLLAVWVTVNFGLVMITFFLPDAPLWSLEAAAVLVALYLAWIDTRVLGRTIQLLYIPTAILSVALGLLLIPRLTQTWALIPSTDFHLAAIGLAAYKGYYLFWGYEVTSTLYPFVQASARPQAERYAYRAMILTFAFFGIGYLLIMAGEGPYLLRLSQWPGVSTMRLITLTSFIINKLGLFVVMLWSLFVFVFLAMRLWCLGQDVQPALGRRSITSYRGALVVFAGLSLGLSLTFANVESLIVFFSEWMTPAMIVFNFGVPPLLLGGAAITRLLASRRRPKAA